MKRILRSAGVLLIISALFTPAAQAYLTVQGNGATTAQSFLVSPTAAVFFRPTGEYYFGCINGAASYSISYASYRTADTAPTLTPLGTTAPFLNTYIDNLAVVPNSALVTSPTIVATAVAAAANAGTDTTVSAISKTSLTPVAATAFNDPAGAVNGGIRALTASRSASTGANVVFAAVKIAAANAGTEPWGAGANAPGGAGVATDGITAGYITQTAGVAAFTLSNVTTGAAGNNARAVSLTVTGSYLIRNGATGPATVTVVSGLKPPMCYDEQLQRLYVGIQGTATTDATPGKSGLYIVNVLPVSIDTATGLITIGAALNQSGNTANTTQSNVLATSLANYIVGMATTDGATDVSGAALKLQTMHTSTGLPYLIVNGGMVSETTLSTAAGGATAYVSKNIFAVPLVNGTPTSINDVGCFASVFSAGHTIKAGTNVAAMAIDGTDLISSSSAAAQVGGSGILPVPFGATLNAAAAANCTVTDMYVDNDAVYVATGTVIVGSTVANTAETGLWKSQAVFNDLGQIDHWTDWQKVAPNDMGGNATTGTGADPRIDFAAVDSYTGHVWTTNATSLSSRVSKWTQPTGTATSQELLASAVNSALGSACYSVLDLNASVTSWGAALPSQITLFGGQEKVCFAITGSRNGLATNAVTAANSVLTVTSLNTVMPNAQYDYTQSSTFVTSSLPSGAGAVVALGWSGWAPDTTTGTSTGFFLAGCAGTASVAPALYIWTPAGITGFNPVPPSALGAGLTIQSPFATFGLIGIGGAAATGSWQKVTNISGMPVKIQANSGALYVLTRSATIDRIYSCPKQINFANLNSTFIVTASSGAAPAAGVSDLSAVKQIYDFVVSVSATPQAAAIASGCEQLIMLTNDGIYTTSSNIGTQAVSNTQLAAGWVLIDGTSTSLTTQGLFSNYISYPAYNRSPQTFWLAQYAVNPAIANVFNKNIQYQASRQSFTVAASTLANALAYSADPTATATFDGALSFNQTTAPTIYANFPVLYRLFYNDGARRFFIQKSATDDKKYQVLALPYNLYDYNITANGKAPMSDAVVAQAGAFYWMSPIGGTGRLMMGTSSGVISLQ